MSAEQGEVIMMLLCLNTSEWITAIGTAVLAILTGVYVVLMYWLRADSLRPFVHLGIETDGADVLLKLQNSGRTEAKNVVINSDPPLTDLQYDYPEEYNLAPFLNHTSIGPGTEYKIFIAMIWHVISFKASKGRDPKFNIKITYSRSNGKTYTHDYILDFGAIAFNRLLPRNDEFELRKKVEEDLRSIAKTLSEISSKFSK